MGVASLYGCRWMGRRGARSRGEARGAVRGWGPTGKAQDRLSACVAANVLKGVGRLPAHASAPEARAARHSNPTAGSQPLDSHGPAHGAL